MSTENPNGSGAADGANSGAGSGGNNNEDKAFLSLKEEKRKLNEKLSAAAAELEALKAEKKAKEEEALKQQGEYRKLYESEQSKAKDLELKLKAKEERELSLRKIDVLMQELGAPLAKPEYWDFFDLSKIPVVEGTNDIDKVVAKQVAQDFSKQYPELLQKKKQSMPNDAASPASALTYADWAKLPLAEKRKRIKDVKR